MMSQSNIFNNYLNLLNHDLHYDIRDININA